MKEKIQTPILGGHYLLLAEANWADSAGLIWKYKGKRIDNGKPVIVFTFASDLNSTEVEKKIKKIETANPAYMQIDSGAQRTNDGMIAYVVFSEPEKKNTTQQPRISEGSVPKAKVREATQGISFAKIAQWAAILFVIVGCVGGAFLAIPLIRSAIIQPTPAHIVTPTPQIFTFTADTSVKNFLTGEIFVIPNTSKVIIVNPTRTACEVLANWNGTQIIVAAKIIFPDRNCP